MTDLIAFALKSEYAGTTAVDDGTGTGGMIDVPTFGGGVYWIGDGDFHVRDELDAGDGTIVAMSMDTALVYTLDVCPVLERVTVPDDAKPISPYTRQSTEDLAHAANIRFGTNHDEMAREDIIAALQADDLANIAAVAAANEIVPTVTPIEPVPNLLALTDAENVDIDAGVTAGELQTDAKLKDWVESATVDDVVAQVGTDRVLAKRVLAAETTGGAGRKGIVEPLTRLITNTQEA